MLSKKHQAYFGYLLCPSSTISSLLGEMVCFFILVGFLWEGFLGWREGKSFRFTKFGMLLLKPINFFLTKAF